ncbi:MAG TPA: GNAT family protein [Pyrinomonadaceae bacterium]|nr:GNAT family protein [Pyrinomonadaceae bacterium]
MLLFEFDKIRLVMPSPEMAGEMARVVRANLEHLRPWMPWAVDDYSQQHARIWIESSLKAFEADGAFTLLIFENEDLIGTIGIHDLDDANRRASMGYWIDKGHMGKGIVTRCCQVVLDHLFDTMELNRVQISANVENIRSRAIPERLGFTHEGILRKVELVQGEFRDHAVYGLLLSEWQSKRI